MFPIRHLPHPLKYPAGHLLLIAGLSTGCGSDPEIPFQFSELRVEELSGHRAMIRFETSLPTTCEIEYGLKDGPLLWRAVDPSMIENEFTTDHEVPLENLAPSTTYAFRARAEDRNGRLGYSPIQTLTTPETGPDVTLDLTNYALLSEGASIESVSSNWANGDHDSAFGAHNAIDGNMATEWSSNGDGDDAFMVIRLRVPQTITHLRFRSRAMSDGTSIIQKFRWLDNQGRLLGTFATPDPNLLYTFPVTSVTLSSFRIEALETSGGNTGAKEIQALGP